MFHLVECDFIAPSYKLLRIIWRPVDFQFYTGHSRTILELIIISVLVSAMPIKEEKQNKQTNNTQNNLFLTPRHLATSDTTAYPKIDVNIYRLNAATFVFCNFITRRPSPFKNHGYLWACSESLR